MPVTNTGSVLQLNYNLCVGLDPAKQGFDIIFQKKRNRLTPSDANFVDCIHTTTSIGYDESLGHVDFWPNGERYLYQPGCKGRKI